MEGWEGRLADDLAIETAPQPGDGAKLAAWTAAAVAAASSAPASVGSAGAGATKGGLGAAWIVAGVTVVAGGVAALLALADPDGDGSPSDADPIATVAPPTPSPAQGPTAAPRSEGEDRVRAPEPVPTPGSDGIDAPVEGADRDPVPPIQPAVDDEPTSERRAAPASLRRRRSPAPEPTPNDEPDMGAAELYARANRARRTADAQAAIEDYRTLQRRFPRSRQALMSRVTLGRMLLERGERTAALDLFEAYLASSSDGTMAEEARWGRAEALAGLGRTAEERRAWEELLRAHPTSVHAPRARARLGSTGGGPD